ncbi:hypothetical protein BGZ60DRAFT_523084 [Tricladium varicosporioides]|nr:hypothetical protein BGZ60DRAFT_523084 [Hymenoscyphus varicosporioides]
MRLVQAKQKMKVDFEAPDEPRNFSCGGAPGHVDFEEMGEEDLGNVEGDTAKKDAEEEEEPFEVLPYYYCVRIIRNNAGDARPRERHYRDH